MKCAECDNFDRRNLWKCPRCGSEMNGGLVFVTGISGSDVGRYLSQVMDEAKTHAHKLAYHDVGEMMKKHAMDDDPDVQWDWILNSDEKALRYLRTLAFKELAYIVKSQPTILHLVDLHLSFRWKAYLQKGFEPHLLREFSPFVRCFVNVVQDLAKIKERLGTTSWGEREILELLVWRDEELFLTDLFANVCGRVNCYAVAGGEPPSVMEQTIWHPGIRKVYLSFPITHLKQDIEAMKEIEQFRDAIRDFLVVFDPYACRDYEETYKKSEMKAMRKEIGETTEQRDYRFIDQADAVVVYLARKVPSKGVDAEMNHARRTGKPIFLYCPEDLGPGPFAVPPTHMQSDPNKFVELLKKELSPKKEN